MFVRRCASFIVSSLLTFGIKVNVSGPIILFQAMYDLLKKSANPRFVSMSSIGRCVGIGLVSTQVPGICYGATKAALNWATRKIHFENDWLGAYG